MGDWSATALARLKTTQIDVNPPKAASAGRIAGNRLTAEAMIAALTGELIDGDGDGKEAGHWQQSPRLVQHPSPGFTELARATIRILIQTGLPPAFPACFMLDERMDR
jgi:hypothetical protein